ncbi:hypothetical protein BBK82_37350 [Lentzea guizhouensis]|uniref:Osmotically inducible protein OsmC n=1 Tax=Lentzea guizhouensis TaxID=1586287 RepID=A0A1B2I069_9PSEU|nr:hypothetical protein BBK82_37350 [Lentzea guizhouensis]
MTGTSLPVGDGDGAWDPEKLYAAALATCLHQAVVLAATTGDLDTSGSAVRARVTLNHENAQDYSIDAKLSITLPNVPGDRRADLLDQAVRHCPLVNGWSVDLED